MRDIGADTTKAKLKAGELVLCMGINQMRTANIGMIAASAGFDAIYIDMEHNPTARRGGTSAHGRRTGGDRRDPRHALGLGGTRN